MKEETKRKLSRVVEIIFLVPALIWIYSPIIAGILFAMVWMFPIAFTSWWLFAFAGNKNWVLGIISVNDQMITLIVFEFLIFGIGLCLFIWGVVLIARAKLKKTGLVQTGPYKYIRHPQHLGLILMTLVISLYIPWSADTFIRIGEILSWSLFTLILFIISNMEERKLVKIYGEEYNSYRSTTGFFFPRLFNKRKQRKKIEEIKYWRRYIFTATAYVCFILLIRLLVYILELPTIRIVGHLFDYLSPFFWYFNIISLILFIALLIVRRYREKTQFIQKG
ncbi:MAG: hypothetical protein H7644_08350 [Candidatus Heimdallarchaeota archaeon]|nr:hypothetical protein [Candidatus Heimdallarchaeota archaeon]MCK5143763.1 hypothetical protein [Candidatus Heimdallarchaeota archaeon]